MAPVAFDSALGDTEIEWCATARDDPSGIAWISAGIRRLGYSSIFFPEGTIEGSGCAQILVPALSPFGVFDVSVEMSDRAGNLILYRDPAFDPSRLDLCAIGPCRVENRLSVGLTSEPKAFPANTAAEVTLRVVGLSSLETLNGVLLRVPTDIPGYEVLGAEILDPTNGALGEIWPLIFNPTTRFLPKELQMTVFDPHQATHVQNDFDFARLILRGTETGREILLGPSSIAVRLSNGSVAEVDLNGEVLAVVGEADRDGDGIGDQTDPCPDSNLDLTIVIQGCDTSVANTLFDDGCTISDLIANCADAAKNHGLFVRCVAAIMRDLKGSGALSGRERREVMHCAAAADVPSSVEQERRRRVFPGESVTEPPAAYRGR
jgi:hypothetical protein